jgi:hypothetical protein
LFAIFGFSNAKTIRIILKFNTEFFVTSVIIGDRLHLAQTGVVTFIEGHDVCVQFLGTGFWRLYL